MPPSTLNKVKKYFVTEGENGQITYARHFVGIDWQPNPLRFQWKYIFFQIHTSVGYKAASLVTDSVVSDIEATFRSYINQGRIADGLIQIADDLRKTLRGITPAHVVLIINMVVLVALGIFLVFFLHLRSVELNVWGAEKFWKIPEYAIYVLSGVWLIDGTIMGVIFISNRAPYWAILIGLLMGITCFLIFSFDEELFGSSTNSGSYNFTSS